MLVLIYSFPPSVTITGGGGVGAAATAAVELSNFGIVDFTLSNNGIGYASKPTVTIVGEFIAHLQAVNLLADNTISDIFLKNAGIGYTVTPTVTISNPSLISGVGNFKRGEIVKGMSSGIEARVKEWDTDTKILKISNVGIGTTTKAFVLGETIQATESTHFIVDSTVKCVDSVAECLSKHRCYVFLCQRLIFLSILVSVSHSLTLASIPERTCNFTSLKYYAINDGFEIVTVHTTTIPAFFKDICL